LIEGTTGALTAFDGDGGRFAVSGLFWNNLLRPDTVPGGVLTLDRGGVAVVGLGGDGGFSGFSASLVAMRFGSPVLVGDSGTLDCSSCNAISLKSGLKLTIGRPGLSDTYDGVGRAELLSLSLLLVAARRSSLLTSLPSFSLTSFSSFSPDASKLSFGGVGVFDVYPASRDCVGGFFWISYRLNLGSVETGAVLARLFDCSRAKGLRREPNGLGDIFWTGGSGAFWLTSSGSSYI